MLMVDRGLAPMAVWNDAQDLVYFCSRELFQQRISLLTIYRLFIPSHSTMTLLLTALFDLSSNQPGPTNMPYQAPPGPYSHDLPA